MLVLRRIGLVAIVVVGAACSVSAPFDPRPSGPDPTSDVRPTPARAPSERTEDGGSHAPTRDADVDESGTTAPGDILGTLSGSCGAVKTQLTDTTSTFEQNLLSFGAGETYDKASLSSDGQRIFDTPNAGGSSTESEVMSFEVLRACEGAKLLKTETEVAYSDAMGGPPTITDLLVEIEGKKVGVSVTRAYRPQDQPFSDEDVKALIQKKLEGINRSSERVTPDDKWVKQILHVFAANKAQADAVVRIVPTIHAAIRANTIVLLTQTTGGGFVYCNPDPPLGSECP